MKFGSDTYQLSFVFWMLLLSIVVFVEVASENPSWLLIPVYLILFLPILQRRYTTYELTDKALIVKNIFSKTEISYKVMKDLSIKDNHWIASILFSFPRQTMILKYEKFDELTILTTDRELKTALKEKIESSSSEDEE